MINSNQSFVSGDIKLKEKLECGQWHSMVFTYARCLDQIYFGAYPAFLLNQACKISLLNKSI